ncbi:MAG: hypothetical protein AAF367_06130 [Pseudomonadota bacterium]
MTFASHDTVLEDDGLLTGLRYALGNTCRLSRATALFSWNLEGPSALDTADELARQVDELRAALPPLAVLIRNRGLVASPYYADAIDTLPVDHLATTLRPNTAAAVLRDGHGEACLSLESALDMAADHAAYADISALTARLVAHQRHIHRLSLI